MDECFRVKSTDTRQTEMNCHMSQVQRITSRERHSCGCMRANAEPKERGLAPVLLHAFRRALESTTRATWLYAKVGPFFLMLTRERTEPNQTVMRPLRDRARQLSVGWRRATRDAACRSVGVYINHTDREWRSRRPGVPSGPRSHHPAHCSHPLRRTPTLPAACPPASSTQTRSAHER